MLGTLPIEKEVIGLRAKAWQDKNRSVFGKRYRPTFLRGRCDGHGGLFIFRI